MGQNLHLLHPWSILHAHKYDLVGPVQNVVRGVAKDWQQLVNALILDEPSRPKERGTSLRYLSHLFACITMGVGVSSPATANPLILVSVVEDHMMVADLGSLNKQAAFPKVWVNIRFSRPTLQNGKRLIETKMLHEFDCRNQEMRPTFMNWEDDKGEKGSAHLAERFTPIVPGEAATTLYRLVWGEGRNERDLIFVDMDHLLDVQATYSKAIRSKSE
jgi:hypothetical protein